MKESDHDWGVQEEDRFYSYLEQQGMNCITLLLTINSITPPESSTGDTIWSCTASHAIGGSFEVQVIIEPDSTGLRDDVQAGDICVVTGEFSISPHQNISAGSLENPAPLVIYNPSRVDAAPDDIQALIKQRRGWQQRLRDLYR